MAFSNFYLIAGGTGSADINAGSSIGAAQAAAATGGSWTNATNTFVATGGTPFATTIVGDYVSVYADGATVTTYVAQVTTVVSNVSVILSATIKYGTAPTDGASNRSAVAGGSWNTEQVLAAGGLASTTVPQSTKINMKGNLTLTATRTISMAGTTTAPLWFSCYTTSPGDLDSDTTNSLTKPVWTLNATFALSWTGSFQTVSGLSVVGNRSGNILGLTGGTGLYIRIRSENTSTNSSAQAAATTGNATSAVMYSWFKTPAATTNSGCLGIGTNTRFVGCVVENGGGTGNVGQWTSTGNATMIHCIGLNASGSAVNLQGSMVIVGFTAYNPAADGIRLNGGSSNIGLIVGSLFALCGGYGINQNGGSNVNILTRSCNDFYSCTSGNENGFGDSPAFFGQTDSSSPVTTSTDMTPITGANARNNGFPGIFENRSFTNYIDIGAVDHVDPTSSGVAGIVGDGSSW